MSEGEVFAVYQNLSLDFWYDVRLRSQYIDNIWNKGCADNNATSVESPTVSVIFFRYEHDPEDGRAKRVTCAEEVATAVRMKLLGKALRNG